MTAPNPTFLAVPPLKLARRYADKEVLDKAQPTEVKWLYDHPVLWLRALHQMRKDVQTHIGKANLELKAAKDFPDDAPAPRKYLKLRQKITTSNLNRLHFLRIVEKKIEEVVSLVGERKPMIKGDVINSLVVIGHLLADDDIEGAKDMVIRLADKLAKELE